MTGPGDFPTADDFGMDQMHATYNPDTGGYHYTVSDSESGARYSWDTDSQGNYSGGGHCTYEDESGNTQH